MSNSQKPSNVDDSSLSFEEQIARHKSRFADAPAYEHRLDDDLPIASEQSLVKDNLANYANQNFELSTSQKRDFSHLKRIRSVENDTVVDDTDVSPKQDVVQETVSLQLDFSDELIFEQFGYKVEPNQAKQALEEVFVEISLDELPTHNASSVISNNSEKQVVDEPPLYYDEGQASVPKPITTPTSDTISIEESSNHLFVDHQVIEVDLDDKSDEQTSPAYIKIDAAPPKQIQRNKVVLSDKKMTAKQAGVIMAITLALITWLKQDRLADYWQQTYQTSEPWTTLSKMVGWQMGEKVGHALDIEKVNDGLASVGASSKNGLNQAFFADKLAQEQAKKQMEQAQQLANEQSQVQANASEPSSNEPVQVVSSTEPLTHITLQSGQKVLFAGDSMMQGVAPWVMRKLQKEYHIDSMDLSKQSTGLSYSSFFDWPATIEKTLADQPNIGALIVFLGANDPWAVPNPMNKAAKYIDFATDEWIVLYHDKMNRILNNAKSHGVQVIWITPPTMKKTKLNEQMAVLTDIMHKGIDKTQVVVMDSKPLLSPSDEYTDSVVIEGKTVKVRTADGIHFTTDGQKHLANHILERIKIKP